MYPTLGATARSGYYDHHIVRYDSFLILYKYIQQIFYAIELGMIYLIKTKIKSIIYIGKQMNLNDNFFEKYDKTWFTHPSFKEYACSIDGYVIYKHNKILKPKLRKNELHIRISLGRCKFQWYLLKRLVYECIHNIDEVPLIMNIDGDIMNNCISNLDLLHIRCT